MHYISIGSQCFCGEVIRKEKLSSKSLPLAVTLPFDWLLPTLEFVHDTIAALYEKSMDEAFELFYDPSNTTICSAPLLNSENEHIRNLFKIVSHDYFPGKDPGKDKLNILSWGPRSYNRKYKVTFVHIRPHSKVGSAESFKIKLQCLKDILLDDEHIRFVYCDPPDGRNQQYGVERELLNEHAGEDLNRLCHYLDTKRKNFDIAFFKFEPDGEFIGKQEPMFSDMILDKRIKKFIVSRTEYLNTNYKLSFPEFFSPNPFFTE